MEIIQQIIHVIILFYKQLQQVCLNILFKFDLISKKNLLENDDNLSYFPSINHPNNLNRQQQTFLNGSNNNNNNNNCLFHDILSNNNTNTTNPISTLSTNTFVNNRPQIFKSLSTMPYPQQQLIRNDENVFHNNHQHGNNVRNIL